VVWRGGPGGEQRAADVALGNNLHGKRWQSSAGTGTAGANQAG